MTTNSREYSREYYQKNREKFAAYQRAHKERRKSSDRFTSPRLFELREDYGIPQKELTYAQRYYAENRETVRAKQKEYRMRKKRCEKQRAYYAANKERIAKQQKEYRHRRARTQKLSRTFLGRLYLRVFG